MDDIIVPELQNVDTTLIIDPDTRTIDAGSDFLLGVETDNDAERVKFQCPKIVGDNLDLSQYHIYIHYQNAKGEKGKYLCEDIEDGGENITFSWLLSQKAVLYKGWTKFLVCAKKTQEETIVWNTTLASGNVLEGLDVDEEIVQQNDDVIEQILLKLEQIEASGGSYTLPIATPTQLGGVKPVAKTDEMTQEVGVDEAGRLFTKEGDGIDEETLNQINRNTEDIGKLSDSKANITYVDGQIAKAQLEGAGVDTSQFVTKDDLNNLEAGGLTDTQITLFEQLFNNLAYTDNTVGKATADSLIASLRSGASSGGNTGGDSGEDGGEDTPTEPTVKTYSITNSLENATTDNNISSIEENTSYTATITPNEFFIFNSVMVTMGGVDVTSTVYANGVINIPQVTGNVIIMVTTLSTKAVEIYSLPQVTTFDGTQTEIDSGVALFEDADQEWSICVDVECSKTGSEHVGSVFTYSNANGTQFELSLTNWYGSIPTWYLKIAGGRTNVREAIESSTNLKAVITKPKGLVQNVTPFTIHWYFEGGTYSSNVNNILADSGFPTADSLMVASNGFKGTIHDLKIYSGILTQDEINEYLGV